MGKTRRAKQKEIPSGSNICYSSSQIADCWEDIIDSSGRSSPLPEHAGKRVVIIVLKDFECSMTEDYTKTGCG